MWYACNCARSPRRRASWRRVKASRLRNVYDPVCPLVCIRRGPDQYKFVDDLTNRGVLAHQENARTGPSAHQEVAEMVRHGLAIVGDENTILLRREREYIRIRNAFQLCLIRGQKIERRLLA